nr:retrovirus-related Pol polyprotein from transposon TNT 1-94 [Tanacetum cinerariifolium]
MQEELNQFVANDVWELVLQLTNMTIIGTKWVFRNKLDENGIVSQNKARLVAQGYNRQEGIDYDETYALVARLESIRILLAYDCALDFKLFQMDVKSEFLNGFINEEVYVAQPPEFIDFEKSDHVYKLKKALYGLKQAPKAWYDRLKAFLIKHKYKIGMTCVMNLPQIMHDEFEMSMMGELNFFLGLQIKQMEDGIFFYQSKYIKEMLKKFGLEDSKPMKTPMSSDTKLTKDEECESIDSNKYRGMIELWYPKDTGIETVVYADSDHVGDYVDRMSTSGICTFVGCCLTSWFLKKQTVLAISTTEAEYVSARKACQQALWMKQALIDYDVRLDDVPIMCDNKGAISKNPVQHSRTKHIEIRHHFLRDNVQKGHISIEKVPSRPRESNPSSSSAIKNHPSSSLPLDTMIDENDDESSHPSSSSPPQQVSSSFIVVSKVRQNPSHESHNLDTFLSETINLQTQQRDAHREGLRSIGQALKNMMVQKRR